MALGLRRQPETEHSKVHLHFIDAAIKRGTGYATGFACTGEVEVGIKLIEEIELLIVHVLAGFIQIQQSHVVTDQIFFVNPHGHHGVV